MHLQLTGGLLMEEQKKNKMKLTILDMTQIAFFAALMAVCAWIVVPVPNIPFTLQVFAIFAALCTLGGKKGTISIIVYILLGAVGAPVFAGFKGGFGVLAGTTGGYIVGFLFSGFVFWLVTALMKKKNFFVLLLSCILGLAACYAFGTAWYVVVYMRQGKTISLAAALMACVVPYIVPDVVKILLAISVSKAAGKVMKK